MFNGGFFQNLFGKLKRNNTSSRFEADTQRAEPGGNRSPSGSFSLGGNVNVSTSNNFMDKVNGWFGNLKDQISGFKLPEVQTKVGVGADVWLLVAGLVAALFVFFKRK